VKYLIILLLLSNLSHATTAVLNLKGTIPEILEVSVVPEPINLTLPLGTTQVNTKIATFTERSNNLAGYKITVTSQNLGKLVKDANNFVTYTMTYDNQPINLSSALGSEFNNNFTNAAPKNKDIKINYTGVDESNMVAGDYVDSVTFTITGN
jgi:hypothetical protein